VSVKQPVRLFHTPNSHFFLEASYSSDLPFAKDIFAQARAYVNAIDFSVVAAQLGFTIAAEAISLEDLIPDSTPDELRHYLEGMLDFAKDGYDNANKTLETFRNVRRDVHAVGRFFFCCPLVFTCSGQLLEKIKPEHDTVMFEFSIHVDGESKSISLHFYPILLTAHSDPEDESFRSITQRT
jgi:hypothetical protein